MASQKRISVRRQTQLIQLEWIRLSRERAEILATHRRVCAVSNQRHAVRSRRQDDNTSENKWASYETLQEINRTMGFAPLADTDASRLEQEATAQFNDSELDRKVCLVTDQWLFPKDATLVRVDELPFDAMSVVLKGEPWVTGAIARYYDCSDVDTRFAGMLLSRRAFERDGRSNLQTWISTKALHNLRATSTRMARAPNGACEWKPPRFAIADGFVAGTYPEIDCTTIIERQTVALAQLRGLVKVVYGGPGNVLQSHLLCWDNRDATIATRIPNVITREHFQLVLAGPMTNAQELLVAKRHDCDGQRVASLHRLLQNINPLYANIAVNDDFSTHPPSSDAIRTNLEESSDTNVLIANARSRQSTVARMQVGPGATDSDECTLVESQTVLIETVADRTEHDRLSTAFANVTGSKTYVARRSSSLLKSTDPCYMERLFPHLLPFGVGGFSMERHHSYSRRAIVLHYLNLATNKFAEDSMYKLVMFDYLSTLRVKSGVFLRVGQDPALATTAMQITSAQLQTAMQNRQRQRAAWKLGRSFIPAQESNSATQVLKSINASTSKMWGSNEERESMKRKVDAMTILYGAPSVFWTLTPNPDCSITCAFWTGRPLPGGRPAKLSECVQRNMPCSSEISRLIMGNTVVQAQYYQACCRLLIDVLFGWDVDENKPKSQRGIFGHVEAFVYALEQQGRLFIHHHGVAWIAGLPKTQSDWDRLVQSDELRTRFEEYCASIFSAELPVYNSIESLSCIDSDCEGSLEPLPVDKKFKHILKPDVPPPRVAKCESCEREVSDHDIVSAYIERQWSSLDDEHKQVSTQAAVEALRLRLGGLSDDKRTAEVQLSRLLLKDQVHAYAHAKSCVKGRSSTKCRYNFFRKLISSTRLNIANELELQRRLGNMWLNAFIPIWRRIFHFNMDSRILCSGDGMQAGHYALQYTVKNQTVLDNVSVVELAFKKRLEREASMDSSEYSRGIGRLLSLAYSNSGVMEIGGPLATAILLAGEAVTFSCVFERLVLVEGLNMLDNVPVQATVLCRNDHLYTDTSIRRYLERPACLESFCWYDFCCWVFKRNQSSVASRPCTFTTNDAGELRTHLKQHGYCFAEYPRVPEIIGPRLPDATRLGNEDYADQSELYYRMVTLLYKPLRAIGQILSGSNSAKPYFDAWQPSEDPKVARALERHQQHYVCLRTAEQYRATQRTNNNDDDDELCTDPDVLSLNNMESATGHRSAQDYSTIPAEFYSVDTDEDMDSDTTARPIDRAPSLQHLLLHSIVTTTLPQDQCSSFTAHRTAITRVHVNKFLREDQALLETTEPASHSSNVGTRTVIVEAFERATRDLQHDGANFAGSEVIDVAEYASIQDVSRRFKLNRLQHIAFTLIALPILSKIAGVPVSRSLSAFSEPSPIIVTGAGGTGKSQIIAAVRALATSWKRPDCIMVVASTGIAAASLNGCTMHSSVGLGINTSRLPKNVATPSDSVLRQWAPILCVIADEVSMIDLGFFGLWEEALRCAKEAPDLTYGGLLTVLMFDHCQLRTVSGAPMYKAPQYDAGLTTTQLRGRRLYRAITKVVYLTENMRFAQDPEWGQWLSSGRLGLWPEALRAFITTLPDFTIAGRQAQNGLVQTISSDNATRTHVNTTATQIAVRRFGADRKVYAIPARLSRTVSTSEWSVLRGLPDNKTGNIPVFLQVYIGMPVRVKSNQCVCKGVVNGAGGTIYHIDWANDTTFAQQPDGTWFASAQPINIYVDISNSPTRKRYPRLPLDWPDSVMPVFQVSSAVTMQGAPISIKGYPLVPAFGTTVHGVQGETRDAVAITNLRPPHIRNVDPHALYVALSRLRTRHGLYWLGQRPTAADFDFFHPNSEVLVEDNRLKHLSNTTITKFSQILPFQAAFA